MTPQSREKTAKTAVFRHRWQAWKVVRSIAAVRQRPRTPRNRRCSFAFFETFLWHFNKKQRAEVIFRLSRPVWCKNQENGSGKRWSLHAPLKSGWIQSERVLRFYPLALNAGAFLHAKLAFCYKIVRNSVRPAIFGKHCMQKQPYELFFILSPRRPILTLLRKS